MRKRIAMTLLGFLALPISGANAQEHIPFDIAATESCLAGKENFARYECIGASANLCMETEGGGSTVGMGFCIGKELDWWDARLNSVYREYLSKEKADDIEYGSSNAPSKADALKAMQRSWIKYRDALCEHSASQWGGGTGAGPAYLSCLLGETGRQVFVLEDRSEWGG